MGTKSAVWNHFIMQDPPPVQLQAGPSTGGPSGSDDPVVVSVKSFRVICKYCSMSVSYSPKATSNLITHLRRRHLDIFQNFPLMSAIPRTIHSKPLAPRTGDGRQGKLTDSIVNLLTQDLIPPSLVDSSAFRELIHQVAPWFILPNHDQLSYNLLPQRRNVVQHHMRHLLSQAETICLSLVLWCGKHDQSFICIMAHFVTDFIIRRVMLHCRRFHGHHTAETVHQNFDEAISFFDIGNRITSVVIDNLGSDLRTLMLPGSENSDPGCDPIESCDDTTDVKGDIIGAVSSDTSILNDLIFIFIPENSPCFARSLERAVKDGLRNSVWIGNMVAKAQSLAAQLCLSLDTSEQLKSYLRPQLSAATKWNRQLKMLRSLLEVLESTSFNDLNCTDKLDSQEMTTLKNICEILQPFEEAADKTDNEKLVTSSVVVICVRGLRTALVDLQEIYNMDIIPALRASVDQHLSNYEQLQWFKLAAALDPRYKLAWCYETEALEIRQVLLSQINTTIPPIHDMNQTPVKMVVKMADEIQTPDQLTPKRSRLMEFMSNKTSSDHQGARSTEVIDYLCLPCINQGSDPLEFWKENQHRYPSLAKLAVKYLSIPASTAPVDSMLNSADRLFKPDTCNLNDEQFEDFMFIRSNTRTPVFSVINNQ